MDGTNTANIIIAIITATGSIVGGFIGAYATIKAAKIKEEKKENQTSTNKSEKITLWKGVIAGTIIGTILTLVALSFFGAFPPRSGTTSPTSTATIENTADSVLFSEDFEDGKSQNLIPLEGNWKVVLDETGNFVYDIDNMLGNRYVGASFGSVLWKDYTVSYRARLLEYNGQKSQITLYFRNSSWGGDSYEQNIKFDNYVHLGFWSGNTWTRIKSSNFNFGTDTWYSVKIEAYGQKITVYINDEKVIDIQDNRRDSGQLVLALGLNTHAQFDDILVTTKEK
jgi:hypothetical protein